MLGAALAEALGDRAGIRRFGDASVPMDEAVATAVIDVGGRPYAVIDLPFRGERIGDAADPARRARPRVVRADRRGDAPPARRPAATTITSPRPRSRPSPARCAPACEPDPRRTRRRVDEGRRSDEPLGDADADRGRRLRRRQPRQHRAGAHAGRRRGDGRPRPGRAAARRRPGRARGRGRGAGDGAPASAPAWSNRSAPGSPPTARSSASASACSSCSTAATRTARGPWACSPGGRSGCEDAPTLPHIGWNQVDPSSRAPAVRRDRRWRRPVLRPLLRRAAGRRPDRCVVLATTEHGRPFVSAVARGSLVGVQFHPERSGDGRSAPAGQLSWPRPAVAARIPA